MSGKTGSITAMSEYLNNWHKIWSNRQVVSRADYSVLQNLIIMDGFDTPLGHMTEDQWLSYIELFRQRCGMQADDSLFEVGCGSGAFLYPFAEQGHEIGGLDYSVELIAHACEVLPAWREDILALEAIRMDVNKKFDITVANQVFHYFSSPEYAREVVIKMIGKTRKTVYITGIPDAALYEESEQERRGILTPEEYEKKYEGLEIQYFDREFFSKIAANQQLDCTFRSHNMPGFAQNKYRFDCMLKKPV
jgi:SAM-dependent methyltransferase